MDRENWPRWLGGHISWLVTSACSQTWLIPAALVWSFNQRIYVSQTYGFSSAKRSNLLPMLSNSSISSRTWSSTPQKSHGKAAKMAAICRSHWKLIWLPFSWSGILGESALLRDCLVVWLYLPPSASAPARAWDGTRLTTIVR